MSFMANNRFLLGSTTPNTSYMVKGISYYMAKYGYTLEEAMALAPYVGDDEQSALGITPDLSTVWANVDERCSIAGISSPSPNPSTEVGKYRMDQRGILPPYDQYADEVIANYDWWRGEIDTIRAAEGWTAFTWGKHPTLSETDCLKRKIGDTHRYFHCRYPTDLRLAIELWGCTVEKAWYGHKVGVISEFDYVDYDGELTEAEWIAWMNTNWSTLMDDARASTVSGAVPSAILWPNFDMGIRATCNVGSPKDHWNMWGTAYVHRGIFKINTNSHVPTSTSNREMMLHLQWGSYPGPDSYYDDWGYGGNIELRYIGTSLPTSNDDKWDACLGGTLVEAFPYSRLAEGAYIRIGPGLGTIPMGSSTCYFALKFDWDDVTAAGGGSWGISSSDHPVVATADMYADLLSSNSAGDEWMEGALKVGWVSGTNKIYPFVQTDSSYKGLVALKNWYKELVGLTSEP